MSTKMRTDCELLLEGLAMVEAKAEENLKLLKKGDLNEYFSPYLESRQEVISLTAGKASANKISAAKMVAEDLLKKVNYAKKHPSDWQDICSVTLELESIRELRSNIAFKLKSSGRLF